MQFFPNQQNDQGVKKISVQTGAKFLHLFSEQLYASPQKAFEELIANSWDAEATHVDLVIPKSLSASDAELMIIDNGKSMDIDGLEKLWQIAVSPKADGDNGNNGRPFIGKFGIGKLATYVLADHLTYVCKDKEGVIRHVTMNYSQFKDGAGNTKLVDDIKLSVYEISQEDLFSNLQNRKGGKNIINFINGKNLGEDPDFYDEYNCAQGAVTPPSDGTWTLVILSSLKEKGTKLQVGRLRQMLRAAMPLGNSIKIRILDESGEGEMLTSKKSDVKILEEWDLGNSIPESFKVNLGGFDKTFNILHNEEERSVSIENMKSLGKITGRFVLYSDPVSGGKSEGHASSNGFFVNILGRVVNLEDNYFGTSNMHHATWARFRCTVRADALGKHLAVSREKLQDSDELVVFRAFLERLFNTARVHYESAANAVITDIAKEWEEKLGFIASQPLQHFVLNKISGAGTVRNMLLENDKISLNEWSDNIQPKKSGLIQKIKIGTLSHSSIEAVKYDMASSSIVINGEHPYVQEYGTGKKEKEIIEVMLAATYLTDVYALDIGVAPELIKQIMQYRENILHAKAMAKRKNGLHIASLLKQYEKDSLKSGATAFEEVVASAFRCLGFRVERKGKSGEEDAFAQAMTLPYKREDKNDGGYSFVIDAKTTKLPPVSTSNLNLESIMRHKDRQKADYAVIVATGYQTGNDSGLHNSLQDRYSSFLCLTTEQVIKLLIITAKYGAIPLNKFRDVFMCGVGEPVDNWIKTVEDSQRNENEKFSWKGFIEGLQEWENKYESVLQPSAIAALCRKNYPEVTTDMVKHIALGIEVMVPQYLNVTEEGDIRINANVEKIAEAIRSHIDQIAANNEE